MIVRIFDTAAAPEDIPKGIELFKAKTQPAFERFPGCHGIEMLIGAIEHSADLVEIAAISRWDSIDAAEAAIKTPEYEEALAELRKLFQQAPIVRYFEAVD